MSNLNFGRPGLFVQCLGFVLASMLSGCGSSGAEGGDDSAGAEHVEESVDCESTSECGDGGLCRDGACRLPEACSGAGDCGFNRECDAERSQCVECLDGDDCASGETCLGQVCRPACESKSDCRGQQECAPNGFCAECIGDGGCADDEHCEQGVCVADLCQGRSTSCTNDGHVLVCSDRGDAQVEFRCPDNESCGTEQGPAWCQGWICVPSTTSCSEDGTTAEACSADGLTIAAITDCAGNDSVCVEDGCEPIICDSYSAYCKDGDVYECNSHGTVENLSRGCFVDEYCDEGTASCRSQVCQPETKGCDSLQVATCNALGSAWVDHEACEASEVCEDGACEPIICTAHERFCEAGHVQRCNALGTGSSRYDTCSLGEFCNDTGAVAVCSVDVCTAGQLVCDGDVLGMCRADGSGIEAGGTTDCAASGQVCHAGECKDVICSEAERLCVAGDVHLCVDKGSATSTYESCEVDEFCDDLTATCQSQNCTPSAPGCDGEVARVCNVDGSDWELGGTDCASLTNKACDAGVCEDVICSPGGRHCNGTQVMTCNVLGTDASLYQACPSNRYCEESSPSTAYCRDDLCANGQPTCDGEFATTCAADGSGPLAGGTDCSALDDEVCWEGACSPQVCSGALCVGGDYHSCVENQTGTQLLVDCDDDIQYCDDATGCQNQLCSPGQTWCETGSSVATCNGEGSDWAVAGCAASEACWLGACEPVICANGITLCDSGDHYLCEQNGTVAKLLDTCEEAEYCDEAIGCVPDQCAAGAALCDENTATVCEPDGSGPVPGGTDCDLIGEGCAAGSCEPVVCVDDSYTCTGDDLYHCEENGTVQQFVETCGAQTTCSEVEGQCLREICVPGETVCWDLDTVLTCSTDGMGFDIPGAECTGGQVCDRGACVDQADACSLADTAWGTPELFHSSVRTPSDGVIGSDAQGNVTIGWIDDGKVYLAHRSAGDGSFEVRQIADGSYSYYYHFHYIRMVVSLNGDALVLYVDYDGGTTAGGVYNYAKDEWGDPLDFTGYNVGVSSAALGADANGRFVVAVSAGTTTYLNSFYPATGWATPTVLTSTSWQRGTGATMTSKGHAAAVWEDESDDAGVMWSRFDPDSREWTAPSLIEGPLQDRHNANLVSMDEDLSDVRFVYEVENGGFEDLHYAKWTDAGGLETPSLIDVHNSTSQDLMLMPDGSLFVHGSSSQFHLPAGSDVWQETTESLGPMYRGVVYPRGELLMPGTRYHLGTPAMNYFIGGAWSSDRPISTIGHGRVTKLPGCGAAWVIGASGYGKSLLMRQ